MHVLLSILVTTSIFRNTVGVKSFGMFPFGTLAYLSFQVEFFDKVCLELHGITLPDKYMPEDYGYSGFIKLRYNVKNFYIEPLDTLTIFISYGRVITYVVNKECSWGWYLFTTGGFMEAVKLWRFRVFVEGEIGIFYYPEGVDLLSQVFPSMTLGLLIESIRITK